MQSIIIFFSVFCQIKIQKNLLKIYKIQINLFLLDLIKPTNNKIEQKPIAVTK